MVLHAREGMPVIKRGAVLVVGECDPKDVSHHFTKQRQAQC